MQLLTLLVSEQLQYYPLHTTIYTKLSVNGFQTLIMEAETVSETLDCNSILTRLIVREIILGRWSAVPQSLRGEGVRGTNKVEEHCSCEHGNDTSGLIKGE
jgi:hypothetical protein